MSKENKKKRNKIIDHIQQIKLNRLTSIHSKFHVPYLFDIYACDKYTLFNVQHASLFIRFLWINTEKTIQFSAKSSKEEQEEEDEENEKSDTKIKKK